MTAPLVSIIIPCFNAEKYVGEAIQSALAQTWPNKEVIVIDDGSTDDSLAVIKSFGNRIKWETGPNRGACAARNRGVSLASGVYLQFLDADDQLAPDKVRHQMAMLATHGLPSDTFIAGAATRQLLNGGSRVVLPLSDPWIGLIESKLGITGANLFSRQLLSRVEGWNEKMDSSQEYDLMFRMLKCGAMAVIDFESLTTVYERSGSISMMPDAAYYRRYIELRLQIKEFLFSQCLLSAEREKAVDRAIHDTTRWLYKVDKKEAVKMHNELLGRSFKPTQGTRSYRVLYRAFGFFMAEELYAKWGWVRRLLHCKP